MEDKLNITETFIIILKTTKELNNVRKSLD
jgi:hypothetical protein